MVFNSEDEQTHASICEKTGLTQDIVDGDLLALTDQKHPILVKNGLTLSVNELNPDKNLRIFSTPEGQAQAQHVVDHEQLDQLQRQNKVFMI